jgi:hypothetical protein
VSIDRWSVEVVRVSAVVVSLLVAGSSYAQSGPSGQAGGMQMPMPMASDQQQMPAMPENPLDIDHVRDGSGTSWLPDASPMLGVMTRKGPWMLMLHGNAFVQFIKTGSDRGDDQFGSINWIMGMAQRALGGGQIQFRTMLSAEPLTVRRCGYPTLVQSGESCRGVVLHDRQHPHDVFMEVAADYRQALNESIGFELYGGPAGEPALGPTAFPHRLSAMPNPVAPISHHWLDSTHVSFGVVTGGVYGKTWKAEASAFNGREPDDDRNDINVARLDSYAGRLSFLPTPNMSLQVSVGHLKDAEVRADGPAEDVNRVTASLTYHRLVNERLWATTVAWGRNREEQHATPAFAIETAADVSPNNVVYARAEVIDKTAAELVLPRPEDETYTIAKLQAGYTRWLWRGHGLQTGVGGSVGLSLLPSALEPFYGSRRAGEFSVFFTIRPHY